MKKVYFTPGPSQVYPTVSQHIKKAIRTDILSLSHRGEEFKNLFKDTLQGLKKLLNIPKDYSVFFVSSALESMERTIQGCVQSYSFHIITGSFGRAWANIGIQLGKNVIKKEAKNGEGIQLNNLEIPKRAELVCITQNDTSTGVWIPEQEIHNLKKRNPEKLIAVDLVSSIPICNIDYQYIDVAFFSVQKGFGLPAGLGIMIVAPSVLAKTEALFRRGINIGSYHSLKNLSEKAKDCQTPETPNVLNIYLLNQVIKDMTKVGLKKIRQDTGKKAEILYKFFDNHKIYQPFIKNPQFRSPTTLVIDVGGQSEKLRRKLKKFGFIIGAGYGDNKLNHIRIANFPSHKLTDVRRMLKYI